MERSETGFISGAVCVHATIAVRSTLRDFIRILNFFIIKRKHVRICVAQMRIFTKMWNNGIKDPNGKGGGVTIVFLIVVYVRLDVLVTLQ